MTYALQNHDKDAVRIFILPAYVHVTFNLTFKAILTLKDPQFQVSGKCMFAQALNGLVDVYCTICV